MLGDAVYMEIYGETKLSSNKKYKKTEEIIFWNGAIAVPWFLGKINVKTC